MFIYIYIYLYIYFFFGACQNPGSQYEGKPLFLTFMESTVKLCFLSMGPPVCLVSEATSWSLFVCIVVEGMFP